MNCTRVKDKRMGYSKKLLDVVDELCRRIGLEGEAYWLRWIMGHTVGWDHRVWYDWSVDKIVDVLENEYLAEQHVPRIYEL